MPIKIDRAAYDKLGPAARQEVDAALASFAGKAAANPMTNYFPSAKQRALLDAWTAIVAAFAGNRFGKTSAGVIKCLIDALDEQDVPDHLRHFKKWDPPFSCWILAPTLEDSIEQVIIPEIKKWVPESALMGGSWEKGYQVGRRQLIFRNGSKFKFFTYKQDAETLTGAAVNRIWYDEPPPQKHRNEAMMRLSTLNGDELFTMTPLHGVSWLQKAIWKERHDPTITVIKGSGLDNPIVNKESHLRIISQYPEEEQQARLHGDFVFFSGRIFPEFNHKDHVVPEIMPRDLAEHEVIVSIDPGWDHGFAVTFNAFDINGCCLTFDEIHGRKMTIAQLVPKIKDRLAYWRIDPAYFLIDGKGGRQTSVITGYSAKKEFSRWGIFCRYAKNDPHSWMPSVNRMRDMLATIDENGEPRSPRLKATENCTYTIDGYLSYHFKSDAQDESREDSTPRPYKKDDDELDTVRYAVMSRTYQDPYFMVEEVEEEPPDLHRVAAMGYHLEQLRREEELAANAYY